MVAITISLIVISGRGVARRTVCKFVSGPVIYSFYEVLNYAVQDKKRKRRAVDLCAGTWQYYTPGIKIGDLVVGDNNGTDCIKIYIICDNGDNFLSRTEYTLLHIKEILNDNHGYQIN